MVGPVAGAVRLPRGAASRLRPYGLLEALSWLGTSLTIRVAWDVVRGDQPLAGPATPSALVSAALVIGSLAVRAAVVTERVEASADGLRWRGLFRTGDVPWAHVARIDATTMALFPRTGGVAVLRVCSTNGTTRKLRASASCARAWPAFLDAAAAVAAGSRPPP